MTYREQVMTRVDAACNAMHPLMWSLDPEAVGDGLIVTSLQFRPLYISDMYSVFAQLLAQRLNVASNRDGLDRPFTKHPHAPRDTVHCCCLITELDQV